MSWFPKKGLLIFEGKPGTLFGKLGHIFRSQVTFSETRSHFQETGSHFWDIRLPIRLPNIFLKLIINIGGSVKNDLRI